MLLCEGIIMLLSSTIVTFHLLHDGSVDMKVYVSITFYFLILACIKTRKSCFLQF